ncbi:MAG: hypothetical protein KJ063_10270 [Anaerolineae bacterium]|nr:hypothetical protein [Anaerolineae bacterium]
MLNTISLHPIAKQVQPVIMALRPHPRFAVMSSCWVVRDAAATTLSNFYNPWGTRPTHPDTWLG